MVLKTRVGKIDGSK